MTPRDLGWDVNSVLCAFLAVTIHEARITVLMEWAPEKLKGWNCGAF